MVRSSQVRKSKGKPAHRQHSLPKSSHRAPVTKRKQKAAPKRFFKVSNKVLKKKHSSSLSAQSRQTPSDGALTTVVDVMYQEVVKKKQIPIAQLATKYKISVDRVESWFSTLTENHLVELKYPLIGSPYVVSVLPENGKPKSGKTKDDERSRRTKRRILLELLLVVLLLLFAVYYFRIIIFPVL